MLIACPYCGSRDVAEFTYQGDANRSRPDPASTDLAAWNDYVYQRANPAGPHREYWQHSGGCRSHLLVTRNTLTHEIASVDLARRGPVASSPAPSAPRKRTTAPRAPRRPVSRRAKP